MEGLNNENNKSNELCFSVNDVEKIIEINENHFPFLCYGISIDFKGNLLTSFSLYIINRDDTGNNKRKFCANYTTDTLGIIRKNSKIDIHCSTIEYINGIVINFESISNIEICIQLLGLRIKRKFNFFPTKLLIY